MAAFDRRQGNWTTPIAALRESRPKPKELAENLLLDEHGATVDNEGAVSAFAFAFAFGRLRRIMR